MTMKILSRIYLPAGKILFREGDEAGKAYYIESGSVEIFRTDSEHKDHRLAVVDSGEIVGELAFFDTHKARTASVRALEDCTVVGLSRAEIESFIDTMDKPARALFKLLMQRLTRANDQLTGHFKGPADFGEAGRRVIENMRAEIKHGSLMIEFDKTVLPEFNNFLAVLREFEKKQKSKDG